METVPYEDLLDCLETVIYYRQHDLVHVQVKSPGKCAQFGVTPPVLIGDDKVAQQVYATVRDRVQTACLTGGSLDQIEVILQYRDAREILTVTSDRLDEQFALWRDKLDFQSRQMVLGI